MKVNSAGFSSYFYLHLYALSLNTFYAFVELAATTDEFAKSILTVASSEINQSIEKELTRFGEVQKEVTTYHDKQAKHDLYFLANTLDEYVRLMSSVKVCACSV